MTTMQNSYIPLPRGFTSTTYLPASTSETMPDVGAMHSHWIQPDAAPYNRWALPGHSYAALYPNVLRVNTNRTFQGEHELQSLSAQQCASRGDKLFLPSPQLGAIPSAGTVAYSQSSQRTHTQDSAYSAPYHYCDRADGHKQPSEVGAGDGSMLTDPNPAIAQAQGESSDHPFQVKTEPDTLPCAIPGTWSQLSLAEVGQTAGGGSGARPSTADSMESAFDVFPSYHAYGAKSAPSMSSLDFPDHDSLNHILFAFRLPPTPNTGDVSPNFLGAENLLHESVSQSAAPRRGISMKRSTSSLDGAVSTDLYEQRSHASPAPSFSESDSTTLSHSPRFPSASPNTPNEVDPLGRRHFKRPKMHQCNVCYKRFPRPSGLATHMNSHSGAKPYKCPIPSCEKTFAVRSNAKRHLRTHGIFSLPDPRVPTSSAPQFSVGFQKPQVTNVPDLLQFPQQLRWIPQTRAAAGSGNWPATPSTASDSEYDEDREGEARSRTFSISLPTLKASPQGLGSAGLGDGRGPYPSGDNEDRSWRVLPGSTTRVHTPATA